jgi:hypothetical protein
MVAFSGSEPIGVLIGAKRRSGTLVHKIAVHPDHRRQGHGRHLLSSLGSKLAILGPPRIIVEFPDTLAPACGLFSDSGYVQEAVLTDYVVHVGEHDARQVRGETDGLVIPVTVDDLVANGLLDEVQSQPCWERSVETLRARKDEIEGLAVATEERIEAFLLYVKCDVGPESNWEASRRARAGGEAGEIVSLRSFIEDGGARLELLLSHVRARDVGTFRFPKVHPTEISKECLETLGFHPAGGHLLYATKARSE